MPEPPKKRTGKKVAVVGSGPAGFRAAAQLNKAGHLVTVFERADRPGGLLMYGIPNMKLDKQEVVLRRIELLEKEGVKFVCNTEVGKNYPAEKLLEGIRCGDPRHRRDQAARSADSRPRSSRASISRWSFSRRTPRRCSIGTRTAVSSTPTGKDVVVIGGGDTGTDCVGTSHAAWLQDRSCRWKFCPSRRWNAPRTIRGPNGRRLYKMDYGQEEAAAKFGADPRVYLTTATKFEGDANGHVKAVHTVQVEWAKNDKGQFIPKNVPGTEKVLPAQLVLLAMGFLGPEQPLLEALGIERDPRTNAKADFEKYTTNIRKACLPAAIAVAARASSSGPSTKAAARRANATVILMGATDLP